MEKGQPDLKILASRWARLVYTALQVTHDFAYFGYITIQPLIILGIFEAVGVSSSFSLTVFIISLHLLFQFVLETPSGAYADNKGRMVTVRNSFAARAAAMVFLAIAVANAEPGKKLVVIVALIFLQIMMAWAEALFTGSIEAWLVDTLKYCDKDDEVGEAFAMAVVKQNIAILVAMPLYVYLFYNIGIDIGGDNEGLELASKTKAVYFLLSVTAFIFVVGGAIAHSVRKEVYRRAAEWRHRESVTWKETWKECRDLLRSSNLIFWAMALMAAPLGAWIVVSWMWPILQETAFGQIGEERLSSVLLVFGLVLGLARVGGSWFCQTIHGIVNPFAGLRWSLVANLGAIIISAILVLWLSGSSAQEERIPVAVAAFAALLLVAKGLEEMVKVFSQIVLAEIIIDSTVRATAISFAALFANILAFVLILLAVAITYFFQTPGNISVGVIVGVVSLVGLAIALYSNKRIAFFSQRLEKTE